MQSVDYSNVIGVQYNESASSLSANILRTAKLEEMLTQVSMSLHMYLNVLYFVFSYVHKKLTSLLHYLVLLPTISFVVKYNAEGLKMGIPIDFNIDM